MSELTVSLVVVEANRREDQCINTQLRLHLAACIVHHPIKRKLPSSSMYRPVLLIHWVRIDVAHIFPASHPYLSCFEE